MAGDSMDSKELVENILKEKYDMELFDALAAFLSSTADEEFNIDYGYLTTDLALKCMLIKRILVVDCEDSYTAEFIVKAVICTYYDGNSCCGDRDILRMYRIEAEIGRDSEEFKPLYVGLC